MSDGYGLRRRLNRRRRRGPGSRGSLNNFEYIEGSGRPIGIETAADFLQGSNLLLEDLPR
jgi:hypothetical protein